MAMDLRKIVDARVEHMKRLYELAGGIAHDGEKGAFREFFVAELLRPLLPDHFGIGAGVVVDAYGKRQSPQMDVIVYDRRRIPPLMLAGHTGIYAMDSVVAVCEVKSKLEARHYVQIGHAANHFVPPRMHELGLEVFHSSAADRQTIWPLFAVFAYSSDAPNTSEGSRVRERLPNTFTHIKVITVLDKETTVFSPNEPGMETHRAEAGQDGSGVTFVFQFLSNIERTAASRGPYTLEDWLR